MVGNHGRRRFKNRTHTHVVASIKDHGELDSILRLGNRGVNMGFDLLTRIIPFVSSFLKLGRPRTATQLQIYRQLHLSRTNQDFTQPNCIYFFHLNISSIKQTAPPAQYNPFRFHLTKMKQTADQRAQIFFQLQLSRIMQTAATFVIFSSFTLV
jgi:hypothetical protein